MRDEDRSQQDVVYRAPGATSGPVFHTKPDCRQLKETPAIAIAREDAPDRWRVCERCRYAHVPTLDDRARSTVPWATLLGGLCIIFALFSACLGGLL